MIEPAIISREMARSLGVARFYTGQTCKNGHTAERYTRGNRCVVCASDAVKRFSASDNGKVKRAKHKRKYASKPEARAKMRHYKAKFLASPKGKESSRREASARRLRRYGLTDQTYRDLLAKQGDACAVCRRLLSELPPKQVAIDHCHRSGTVRGILCQSCNTMLGHARDNSDVLMSAAAYIDQQSAGAVQFVGRAA